MSCKLEEAIKDIEALASKPGAKSIAKELTQIANEAKESVEMLLKRKIIEINQFMQLTDPKAQRYQ